MTLIRIQAVHNLPPNSRSALMPRQHFSDSASHAVCRTELVFPQHQAKLQ